MTKSMNTPKFLSLENFHNFYFAVMRYLFVWLMQGNPIIYINRTHVCMYRTISNINSNEL